VRSNLRSLSLSIRRKEDRKNDQGRGKEIARKSDREEMAIQGQKELGSHISMAILVKEGKGIKVKRGRGEPENCFARPSGKQAEGLPTGRKV